MERGPLALFGAIIAVGLGPALWMGVQLGTVEVTPTRPPVVSNQGPVTNEQMVGGTGAGDESGGTAGIDTEPRGNVLPLTKSPTPSPSATTTTPAPTPSSTAPSRPAPTATSDDPPYPPTESTTSPGDEPTDEPTDPPTDGDDDGDETQEPEYPTYPADPPVEDGDSYASGSSR